MIKNLLSFLIFLLSGYSQMFAHANQDCTHYSVAKNILVTEQTRGRLTESGQVLKFKSILSASDIKHTRIVSMEDLDEIDDDKLFSLKKHSLISKSFVSTVFTQTFGSFTETIKAPQLYCKYFSYFTSYRYLLFRVLRI